MNSNHGDVQVPPFEMMTCTDVGAAVDRTHFGVSDNATPGVAPAEIKCSDRIHCSYGKA